MKFGQDAPSVLSGTGKRAKILSPAVVAPLIKARLAELVYRNGGTFIVSSWGMVQAGVGIYERVGLDAADAFDLVYLHGILVGFALASNTPRQQVYDEVLRALKDVWREKGWSEEE